MKQAAILLYVLFMAINTVAQKTLPVLSNPRIDNLVRQIALSNKYESSHVGFAGSPSEQYTRMRELKAIASEKDLLQLVKHPNAAVRIYSYLALRSDNPQKAQSVYKTLAKDTTAIFTLEGCLGGESTVGNILKKYNGHD